jgi:hypothetical protein
MFAFADPEHVTEVLTTAGWAPPRFEKLDMDLDIAAGRGLEEAVVQSTQIGAVNSWLRNQPAEVVSAVVASLREALAPYANGASVRLPGAMWLISSAPARTSAAANHLLGSRPDGSHGFWPNSGLLRYDREHDSPSQA